MKNSKKIISLVFSLLLFFSVGVNVKAASFDELGKIVDGSKLLDLNESTVTLENIGRGNILNNGTADRKSVV